MTENAVLCGGGAEGNRHDAVLYEGGAENDMQYYVGEGLRMTDAVLWGGGAEGNTLLQ